MTENIVRQNASLIATDNIGQDITKLLDRWMEAERSGIQFPVPLHDHWNIAGHKKVQDVFNLLESRQEEGFDFLRSTVKTTGKVGRKRQARFLTVAALERLCLASHTPEGDTIRELYRQSKAKWDLVKQIAPKVSEEVEILAMKIELAKIETQKIALEDKLLNFRHYLVSTQPKPIADRVLGVTEIKDIEYRDRVYQGSQLVNTGDTINKTDICQMFGLITKSGAPDYKGLKRQLAGLDIPDSAWEETFVIQKNVELKRSYLPELDRALYTAEQRQLWIGESA